MHTDHRQSSELKLLSASAALRKTKAPLGPDAMDRIWMQMTARYGISWTSQYGPMPDGCVAVEWRETLAGISPRQLRDGFANDVKRADKWPPTSPVFRALCLSGDLPAHEPTVAEIAAAKQREHADDLAFFRRRRELCAARGLDLWEKEAKEGIPHHTRPVKADPAVVAAVMRELERLLPRLSR